MAYPIDHRTDTEPVKSHSKQAHSIGRPEGPLETRPGDQHEDPFDFAAWLQEYRRWTERGCCTAARRGEIEWGGEESS
jgi:hypothetical protein